MDFILYLPALLFSVIIHEVAHGYAAYRFGDDTAYYMGRLTLNPMAHIDAMGTFIFPATLYLLGLPMLGWAKPVPVNPARIGRKDMTKVAFAGPLSNLLLTLLAVILMKIFIAAGVNYAPIFKILTYVITINLVLALFNLIPIPPLDGGNIVMGLLPPDKAAKYGHIRRYGFLILLLLVFTGAIKTILLPALNFTLRIISSVIGAS